MEDSWKSLERAPIDGNTYRILLVCTGNICRSPFAEAKLRQALGHHGPVTVESAGTRARTGAPVAAETRHLFTEHGLSYDGFRAQPLTAKLLETQDLVICMAQEHRKQVLQMAPNLLNQSFTLLELARILMDFPPIPDPATVNDWIENTARAAHQRSDYRRDADDVVDPIGQGQSVAKNMERQILLGIDALTSWYGKHEHSSPHVTETSLNSTGTGSE